MQHFGWKVDKKCFYLQSICFHPSVSGDSGFKTALRSVCGGVAEPAMAVEADVGSIK